MAGIYTAVIMSCSKTRSSTTATIVFRSNQVRIRASSYMFHLLTSSADSTNVLVSDLSCNGSQWASGCSTLSVDANTHFGSGISVGWVAWSDLHHNKISKRVQIPRAVRWDVWHCRKCYRLVSATLKRWRKFSQNWFRNIKMANAQNGARIKCWAGSGVGSGIVKNITFNNFQVTNVDNPIIIDQVRMIATRVEHG